MMTAAHRRHLEALSMDSANTFRRVALRAALADLDQVIAERDMTIAASRQLGDVYRQLKADLDACRKALALIVRELKAMPDAKVYVICLDAVQAAAVLAAAGEPQP